MMKLFNCVLQAALSIILMLSWHACQDQNLNNPMVKAGADAEAFAFSFACSSLEQGGLRADDWQNASLNTGTLDRVSRVRVLSVDPATGDLKSALVYDMENNREKNKTYGPFVAPIEGNEVTYYFIANEDPNNELDIQQPASYSLSAADLFAKTSLEAPNYMTAVYKVKRAADGSIQYRREYPSPHAAGQYKNAEVSRSARGEQIAIPVVLFPIRSRFQLDIDYDQAKKLGFTQENIEQQLQLKFGGFRPRRMLFTADYQAEPGEKAVSYTDAIALPAGLAAGGKQSQLYYLPATGSDKEQLEISYTQHGYERKKLITAVTGTAPNHGFQYNTIYTLGVGFQKSYDLVIAANPGSTAPHEEPIFSRLKNSDENITNRPIDYKVFEGDTTAYIHVAVGHKYRGYVQLKSKNAPAEIAVIDDYDQPIKSRWIKDIKEESRYSTKVDDAKVNGGNTDGDVYYYQTFSFIYDIDNPERRDVPLITKIRFQNRRDPSQIVDLHLSYNVASRFAKLNLGKLNTFANGRVDDKTATEEDLKKTGMLYQWGRNVPFDPKDYDNWSTQNVIYLGSPSIAQENVLYYSQYYDNYSQNPKYFPQGHRTGYPAMVHTWWRQEKEWQGIHFYGESIPDNFGSWAKFVKHQRKLSIDNGTALPDAYEGNNNGDPCPPSYSIPPSSSMKLLVYNLVAEGYARSNQGGHYGNYKTKEVRMYLRGNYSETGMNASGNPEVDSRRTQESYNATYALDENRKICYALRFSKADANSTNRFLTAFKYDYSFIASDRNVYGNPIDVQISVVTIKDPNVSMVDIMQDNFWGNYEDSNNPYAYNKYLKEELYFPHNPVTRAFENPKQVYDMTPDIWTGTALSYAGAMDIDMIVSTQTRYAGSQSALAAIRCQRN